MFNIILLRYNAVIYNQCVRKNTRTAELSLHLHHTPSLWIMINVILLGYYVDKLIEPVVYDNRGYYAVNLIAFQSLRSLHDYQLPKMLAIFMLIRCKSLYNIITNISVLIYILILFQE